MHLFVQSKEEESGGHLYAPGKDILDTYYVANCWNEFEKEFEETVIREHDWKLEKRKELYRKEFGDMGEAGKKFANILLSR